MRILRVTSATLLISLVFVLIQSLISLPVEVVPLLVLMLVVIVFNIGMLLLGGMLGWFSTNMVDVDAFIRLLDKEPEVKNSIYGHIAASIVLVAVFMVSAISRHPLLFVDVIAMVSAGMALQIRHTDVFTTEELWRYFKNGGIGGILYKYVTKVKS